MTRAAKHTPGPWKAVRDEQRNPHYAWNVEGAQGIVPTIARLSMIDAGAQIEPNAHLIAAAPAMYEALQATLAYFMRSKQSHAPEVQAIRTALAQAEGKHD